MLKVVVVGGGGGEGSSTRSIRRLDNVRSQIMFRPLLVALHAYLSNTCILAYLHTCRILTRILMSLKLVAIKVYTELLTTYVELLTESTVLGRR